jgi:hypothetical protein
VGCRTPEEIPSSFKNLTSGHFLSQTAAHANRAANLPCGCEVDCNSPGSAGAGMTFVLV